MPLTRFVCVLAVVFLSCSSSGRAGENVVPLNLSAFEPQAEHEQPKLREPLPSSAEIARLPKDGGNEFNRLVFELSPYLRQHARNPVDWFPWGPEAFEKAAAEDKPVFLSVGYSTCHWCHVMEHESFEDEQVAALMNEHFVCVKVDREERPDIDQVYMAITQALTGRGGWPMTVLMTPDKNPFFAGTYFPKHSRGGREGMLDMIPRMAEIWKTRREDVIRASLEATGALKEMSSGTAGGALDPSVLERAYQDLSRRFEPTKGGFSQAPKFPIPHNLRFLLRWHARSGDARALQMVELTLTEMRKGGIWDHLGYGFHRYSTDKNWLLPHFEKMLYDQALIAMACVETWQVTGDQSYRDTAERIFEYVLRDMTAPGGAFYSAEDADSEGEEGVFYVWTTRELEQVLGKERAELAIDVWGASPGGNFVEQTATRPNGTNILHLPVGLKAKAAAMGQKSAELEKQIEGMRSVLFEHREKRIHPFKDDKIMTDWNGLMIAALATAAQAFDDPRHELAARRAADWVLANLRDKEGRLLKRARGDKADLPGMLEDYSFLTWGLIELYQASFHVPYLQAALDITDDMLAHFGDAEEGGFYLSPDDGEVLIVRSKEIYDGALPSGNSVAVANLIRLARITGEVKYEEVADKTIRAFSGAVSRNPSAHTQLLMALDLALGPMKEIVVAGDPDSDSVKAMLRALRMPFMPRKVVVLRPEGDASKSIVALAPYAAGQVARNGMATAYVCEDFACKAPTNDLAEMVKALAE